MARTPISVALHQVHVPLTPDVEEARGSGSGVVEQKICLAGDAGSAEVAGNDMGRARTPISVALHQVHVPLTPDVEEARGSGSGVVEQKICLAGDAGSAEVAGNDMGRARTPISVALHQVHVPLTPDVEEARGSGSGVVEQKICLAGDAGSAEVAGNDMGRARTPISVALHQVHVPLTPDVEEARGSGSGVVEQKICLAGDAGSAEVAGNDMGRARTPISVALHQVHVPLTPDVEEARGSGSGVVEQKICLAGDAGSAEVAGNDMGRARTPISVALHQVHVPLTPDVEEARGSGSGVVEQKICLAGDAGSAEVAGNDMGRARTPISVALHQVHVPLTPDVEEARGSGSGVVEQKICLAGDAGSAEVAGNDMGRARTPISVALHQVHVPLTPDVEEARGSGSGVVEQKICLAGDAGSAEVAGNDMGRARTPISVALHQVHVPLTPDVEEARGSGSGVVEQKICLAGGAGSAGVAGDDMGRARTPISVALHQVHVPLTPDVEEARGSGSGVVEQKICLAGDAGSA